MVVVVVALFQWMVLFVWIFHLFQLACSELQCHPFMVAAQARANVISQNDSSQRRLLCVYVCMLVRSIVSMVEWI